MKKTMLLSKIEISGKRIYLRKFEVSDISEKYIYWLNDPQVSEFLSINGQYQTIEMVERYVDSYTNSNDRLLLGVFLKQTNCHIGNLTFSVIDWVNCSADIGICIGDKQCWRKGYGVEALDCIKRFSFDELKLNKLRAGVCNENTASVKLFEKAGFSIEKKIRQRGELDSVYKDGLIMALLR